MNPSNNQRGDLINSGESGPVFISQPTQSTPELALIDLVDSCIHAITRRHIPDYPEAQELVAKLNKLITSKQEEELTMLMQKNATPGTIFDYVKKRITQLHQGRGSE